MPEAQFPVTSVQVGSLASLADRFDVFLLDAFGVLNVGKTAIPSALERVATLQASGKKLLVLSNSATLPKAQTCAKLNRIGYNFSPQNIVTSREALQRFANRGTQSAVAPQPAARPPGYLDRIERELSEKGL